MPFTMHRLVLCVSGGVWAAMALLGAPSLVAGQREIDYPGSLKGHWVPQPTRLGDFVVDEEALSALGKALFWDVAIGSDGQTACASCHGHAGVDPRRLNTVHPGANGTFDTKTGAGELKTADFFPTTVFADPASRFSSVLRDLDDVAGSQGVLSRRFVGIVPGRFEEVCESLPEAVFVLDGIAQRQVTARNPPTVINAVFNIRNFWDGRANHWFNGRNGLGPLDPDARVWVANPSGTALASTAVMLDFSSLASQATGPALNPVEMSCDGRTWPDLAGKVLDRRPLATQRVHREDSLLGALVAADGMGLDATYRELVDAAFLPRWRTTLPTPEGVPQVEANFPLFFGLAVQAYEAKLVSDDSRYDRFAEAGFPEDGGGLLDAEELRGLAIFMNRGELEEVPVGRCVACHGGPLFASPTWPAVGVTEPPPPGPSPRPAPDGIERMLAMAGTRLARVTFADGPSDGDPRIRPLDFPIVDADLEIVRLTGGGNEVLDWDFPDEDELPCPGDRAFLVEADDGGGTLLVEIRRQSVGKGGCETSVRFSLEEFPVGIYALRIDGEVRATLTVLAPGAYDQGFYNIGVRPTAEDLGLGGLQAGGVPLSWSRRRQQGFPLPEVSNPTAVPAGVHAAVDGAFKTPSLRNVELTGPFFHNGGQATLRQVVEFYNRGGDFHEANLVDLSPDMESLGLAEPDIEALVAFMEALTDERVRDEQGPFDHPELPLPNGTRLPAVGAKGRAAECLPPLASFEERLAGGDPTGGEGGDCDGNGVPDACESHPDEDGDRVPDPCERAAGDFNLDGEVGSVDLAWLLAVWGSTVPSWSFADLDRDGRIGSSDLTLLLSRWGPVP
jgi:cytochrome c peroxidase